MRLAVYTFGLVLAMIPAAAMAQMPLHTVDRVVIDPGHGGDDLGTEGHGVQEKDLVLQMSLDLAAALRAAYPGLEVVLTRDSDTYPTLEERTHLANLLEADLFISVHANAAPNLQAHGIETFFLAAEGTAPGQVTPGQEDLGPTVIDTEVGVTGDVHALIVHDLHRQGALRGSARLADVVQSTLVDATGALDRGVRTGQFRVLRGAMMPAVVVETGFLSNEDEGSRLLTADYQQQIIDGLVRAVATYDEGQYAVAQQWQLSAERLALGE
jgi:N-acetylmuramoyl-L-alanine amidase